MVITNKIKIDLLERGSTIVVYAVQSDKYSRSIDFSLYEGGVKWIPSPSTTAVVAYKKPDGTGGEYDTLPNGETAYSFSENDVTVALAPQVLTVPGRVILSVGLLEGESILYSFPVEICVIQNPGIVTHSENYFKILGALADSGWEPNMFLCTDENGNVVSVPAPSGVKGEKGDPGEDGGYYIPQITEPTAGVIRFAFNGTKATMQPIIPSDFNLPRGEQGVQGEKGEPGEKGEAGEKGDIGPQGIKGDKGEKGDKGDVGAAGEKGADGVPCTHSWNGTILTVNSASGSSSANLKGDQGDKGEKGDPGIPGEKGDPGIQGEQGIAGKSAYETAKEGGFAGTEEEFAAKLAEDNGAKVFYVAVTQNEDGSYTCDKGYDEIKEAYEKGCTLTCVYNGAENLMLRYNEDFIGGFWFDGVVLAEVSSLGEGFQVLSVYVSDGDIQVFVDPLETADWQAKKSYTEKEQMVNNQQLEAGTVSGMTSTKVKTYQELKVDYEGSIYYCPVRVYESGGDTTIVVGNGSLVFNTGEAAENTGEPFLFYSMLSSDNISVVYEKGDSHRLSVWGVEVDYNTIPIEYLPEEVKNGGGSGGVSSWNDLTDRPFGESFDTVLLAEQTVNFEPNEDLGGMNAAVLQGAFADFRALEVKYNGTSYSCGVTDAGGVLAFGNMGGAGMGQDTGEPFIGLVQEGMCIFVSLVDASATVEIKGGTITPISPNYLPYCKLDLTTFFPEGLATGVCSTATLSEDEEEGNRLFTELQSAAKYGGVRLVYSTKSSNEGRDVFNSENGSYYPGERTYDVVPNCVYDNYNYTVLLSAIVNSSIVYVEINSVGGIRATVREINFRA